MVRKKQIKMLAAGLFIMTVMTGCALDGNQVKDGQDSYFSAQSNVIDEFDGTDTDTDTDTDTEKQGGQTADESDCEAGQETEQERERLQMQSQSQMQSQTQSQPQTQDAEKIEKELAAYRAEREAGVSSLGQYTLVAAPNEENYQYGVGNGNDYASRFDSKELNEAFKAARNYVEETLHLESEVWTCVDPRMNAIYEDADKGVANGYDADNIFLCEYNDNGNWQYLILVREGKGADWEVLYHGDSYKTE